MLLCKGQTTLHAEVGVVFQCLFYLMRVSFQIIRFGIEHRQTHPTTDVHPYGIGDDGIVRGEYNTDGQTVSGVCIGERGGQVFGQFAPCLILFISIGVFQHVAQCLDNLFFALVLAMFANDGYYQTACYIVSISQLT